MQLDGKVAFITGSSRGIGKEIALRLAGEGAKIVVTGKTAEPHPELPGTIHETVEEIESLGGEALAIQLDVRFDDQIEAAFEETVERFGSLDILINNAGAIQLQGVEKMPPKRFDLVMGVNARAAYACSHFALPYMIERGWGHILMASPPFKLDKAPGKTAYALSKLGMTFVAQSLAEEVRQHNIGVNAFWPVTAIESQATRHFKMGTEETWRTPEILCDTVLAIVTKEPSTCTGNAFYDEEVLRNEGITDFSKYSVVEGAEPPPFSAMLFDPDYQ